jgi:hypothetical protein
MSVIKPRTRGRQMLQLRSRLDAENMETLHAYACFLGESVEYVLNEVVDSVLGRDKEYLTWRAEHPESCSPKGVPEKAASTRRTSGQASLVGAGAAGR